MAALPSSSRERPPAESEGDQDHKRGRRSEPYPIRILPGLTAGFEDTRDARASSTIFEPWLETLDDLRTALLKDPLPMETIKDLLAA